MQFPDVAGKTEYVYARIKESSRHALEVLYSLISYFLYACVYVLLKSKYNIANMSVHFFKVHFTF